MTSDIEYPNLTLAQLERLAWLAEELGEAQQAVGKILRHGYFCADPDSSTNNQADLEKELSHVLAVKELLCLTDDLCREAIQTEAHRRFMQARFHPEELYLHHQKKLE